jgi:titin
MPVTAVNISPSSATLVPGAFVDLTATVLDTGAPLAGQVVTATSGTPATATAAPIAQTTVDGPNLSSPSAMTLSSPGLTSPRGVTIGRWTETTAVGQHIAYIDNGGGAFGASAGETVGAVAEIKLTGAGRKFAEVFFYDATNGTRGVWFDVTTGALALADAGVTGSIWSLGSGSYLLQIRATYGSAVTLAAGVKTSDSTGGTPNESFAGSESVYLDIGAAWTERSANVTTNASGQATIRVRGVANGTSAVTATSSSVTSSASTVTVGTVTVPVLSGAVTLPSSSVQNGGALTSISVAPTTVSVAVLGTATLTVTGSNGLPVVGASAVSQSPSIATVTSSSTTAGVLTVTGGALGGSTAITISYTDSTNGTLTATVPVQVALATPASPSGLSAIAQSTTSVLLSWTDNASNETAFRIERAASTAGPWVQIGTVGAGVVAYTDTSVVAQTLYYFRVIASNVAGASAPSNVAAVSTPATPDTTAPTCALSASLATVATPGGSVTLTAQVSDNVGVTLVRFYRGGVEFAAVSSVPVADTPVPATQAVSFGTAADNGTYVYTARAFDAAGNSGQSSSVSVVVSIPAVNPVPNAPSGLMAIGAAKAVTITWTDNSVNETAFRIERRSGSSSFAQVAEVAAGATSYTDVELQSATVYTYRVRAQGPGGASGFSAEASATTSPAPATALALVVVSPTQVSDVEGRTATVTYTALDGNGSGKPGVTITPMVDSTAVGTVSPASVVTDAQGRAFLTITFGARISQTTLRVAATDGTRTLSVDENPMVDVFTLPAFSLALAKELQAEQQDPKYADEIQPYVFDFSPYLGRGEDVSRIQVIESVPVSGATADPSAPTMIFGAPSIVGDRVLQYFRDGMPGVSYYLRCRVETTIGRVVVSEIRIRIYRSRGARVSSSSPVAD